VQLRGVIADSGQGAREDTVPGVRTLLIGEALVDLVCERPVASIADAPAFVPRPGGTVANVAVAAARAGGDVALAGGAGDDDWGAWLRDRLADAGVGLDWFTLVEGEPTPVAFVTVDADGEPTYRLYAEHAGAPLRPLAAEIGAAVEAAGALCFASNTLSTDDERALTMEARERALEAGKPVVFDPSFRLHRWTTGERAAQAARACVPGAFLVKANAEEARLLTGERDPDRAAAGLRAAGAQNVVVTLGAEGALLRGGRGIDRDVPGVRADVVDTTGAGDALLGTLLAALGASGYYAPALAAALPDAVAAAARVTERWGA
jgi:sugar/nucleoside kinase (ribokinase family)